MAALGAPDAGEGPVSEAEEGKAAADAGGAAGDSTALGAPRAGRSDAEALPSLSKVVSGGVCTGAGTPASACSARICVLPGWHLPTSCHLTEDFTLLGER